MTTNFSKTDNVSPFGFKNCSRHISVVLLVVNLAIAGCATVDPSARMGKETKVSYAVITKDVLFTPVVSESTIQTFANRVSQQLAKRLSDYGIKNSQSSGESAGDATLSVQITSIGSVTTDRPGPFFIPIVSDHIDIRYTATLLSKDGTRLFDFGGREHSQSLEELSEIVGRYVAKRVAKAYKD